LTHVATLIPKDGVYAARATYRHGAWPAAVNIGPNPTFGEQARKVEVHLIGFTGDLYEKFLAVDLVSRLRDTQRFDSAEQLVRQIQADVARTKELIQTMSGSDEK
jgi:riboflavin kinase/FMN adenylyltransferase